MKTTILTTLMMILGTQIAHAEDKVHASVSYLDNQLYACIESTSPVDARWTEVELCPSRKMVGVCATEVGFIVYYETTRSIAHEREICLLHSKWYEGADLKQSE
jgi:hypothetical protein